MSKFKLNSEVENQPRKKHSTKKNYRENDDMYDFAYMSRGDAKNELRHFKEQYGI